MSWGPNVGPLPLDGSPPRRTKVSRVGGGYKYREDVDALHEDLRAARAGAAELQQSLASAQLEISETAQRAHADELRAKQAEDQLVQQVECAPRDSYPLPRNLYRILAWQRDIFRVAQHLWVEKEGELTDKLREALEAVGTARDAAQSALGSQAATHADMHARAEECSELQRRLVGKEEELRRSGQQVRAAEERLREEARAAAAQMAMLVRPSWTSIGLVARRPSASARLGRCANGTSSQQTSMRCGWSTRTSRPF